MSYKTITIPFYLLVLIVRVSGITSTYFVVDNIQLDKVSVDSIIKNENFSDTLFYDNDSLKNVPVDTSRTLNIRISADTLEAEVKYTAKDSIIYDIEHKMVHLYGEAEASYLTIDLKADYIRYDWTKNTLSAEMNKDEQGEPIGRVVFTESGESYKAERIDYNFKSKKGKAYHVMHDQEMSGEQIYLHYEAVKKNEYDEWYGRKGRFTTCNLDHPHYYIQARKMKLVPDEVVATGPANIVIADVPTPLYIPFGLFPIKKGQRSGLIIGKWGQDFRGGRDFGLTDWGYFFGINDYVNLKLTGDIYFNGTWSTDASSQYNKRYRFSGNIFTSYGRTRIGEPESPSFRVQNDFRINWTHTQSGNIGNGSRFTANVNFGSRSYDKNFSQDKDRIINNSFASKINYSKSWSGRPFSLNMELGHSQSLNTGAITLTLPKLNFVVSRIQPFQSKVGTKRKWYESIGFGYRFETQNIISGYDSTFLEKETFRDARYGIRHSVPISASFKVFKYFSLNPGINYTERWYFQTIRKSWDPTVQYFYSEDSTTIDTLNGQVLTDTLLGFKGARDFNFSLSLTTKVYGQVNFKRTKIKALRHVFTPSLNFSYRPDFAKPFWGNYKQVQSSAEGDMQTYSIFDIVRNVYGAPPSGQVGSIGLNLNNVLEMKVFSKKDTVDQEKKIKLLESLRISGNYNIAADSLNFSRVNISGRTSLYKNFASLDFQFTLDPYTVNDNNTRINRSALKDGYGLFRLTSTSFSIRSSFQSKKAKKGVSESGTQEEWDMIEHDRELFYDFNIPWSVNFGYNFALTKGILGDPDKILVSRNSFDFNFDANITPKWKLSLSSGYDFKLKDFTYTQMSVIRDLHCWEMKFDFVPYPKEYQRYSIQINVRSSILQDLKLTRKNDRVADVF